MSAVAAPRLDTIAWVALVSLAVLWGSAFVMVEVLLEAFPIFTIVALRVAVAALCLWSVLLVIGGLPPFTWRIWLSFTVLGVFNNVIPFTLIVYGQTHITAGLASILNSTTPLFTIVLAAAVLPDEKFSLPRVAGLCLGVVGVAVMLAPEAIVGAASVLGEVAILGAAMSYAVAIVFVRKSNLSGLDPIAIAAGQTTMSSAIMLPAALLFDPPVDFGTLPAAMWLALFVNGALLTAVAYILYFLIARRAGATNAALVTVLVPVVAVIVGVLALGERLSAWHVAGMVLIAAGLAVLDGRVLPRQR